jgi:hypothetical protein
MRFCFAPELDAKSDASDNLFSTKWFYPFLPVTVSIVRVLRFGCECLCVEVSDPSPHEYFMVLFLEILAGRLAHTFGFLGNYIWRDILQIHLAFLAKTNGLTKSPYSCGWPCSWEISLRGAKC